MRQSIEHIERVFVTLNEFKTRFKTTLSFQNRYIIPLCCVYKHRNKCKIVICTYHHTF